MIVGQLCESRGAAELCRYLSWLKLLSHPGNRMALLDSGSFPAGSFPLYPPDDKSLMTLGRTGSRSPATMPAPPSSFRTNSPASP